MEENASFGAFEMVFGIRHSHSAVACGSVWLYEISKHDISRLVEESDAVARLVKRTVREHIYHCEGAMGPWRKEEIEYVRRQTIGEGTTERRPSLSSPAGQRWYAPPINSDKLRKQYWKRLSLKAKANRWRHRAVATKRASMGDDDSKQTRESFSFDDLVGGFGRAFKIRRALCQYSREFKSLNRAQSRQKTLGKRDEASLHFVVSYLGSAYRSLETGIAGRRHAREDGYRAAADSLLRRAGYFYKGEDIDATSDADGGSGARK